MNETIKALWTAALRSADYVQGQGRLRIANDAGELRHCCLGVLCALHSAATGTAWADGPSKGEATYLGMLEYLPADVREWAGLGSINPACGLHPLTAWNDGTGPGTALEPHGFAQIADLIERYL